MNTDLILFSILSFFIFVSAIMVVVLSNAVHSVLFLIIVFCNVASLLLVLGAEFFSFMFLIVYVGAIAVLFLFVVMMLNIKTNPIKIPFFSILPIGILTSSFFFNLILSSQKSYFFINDLNYLIYTP